MIATGTWYRRRPKKKSTSIGGARGSAGVAAVQEGEALEQVHVLLVLEQGAVERGDGLAHVLAAQRLGRDVLRDQQLDPVEQLGGVTASEVT